MEVWMRTTSFAAALAATALSTGFALAQTAAPPAAPPATTTEKPAMSSTAASTQFMTILAADQMRGSKLIGVDVYGSDNSKIGDIDELILDKDGKIQAVVVGVGGFLGIGTKDVAFPYSELTFVEEAARTAAAPAAVSTPANPNAPATTGSTTTTTTTTKATENDGVPDHATVKMTKADLQAAPEFHYTARSATSSTTTTTAPPASSTMPPAAKP
jgi:sporulation protein YlmC with PRC-barrel domain